MEPISNVYLSGWEYNRLLQEEPADPRNSAMPASVLWNGAHQLWMFDHIYVTKEAFENEVASFKLLGWAGGKILQQLREYGVLKLADWTDLPSGASQALQDVHCKLRSEIRLSDLDVFRLIEQGDVAALELLKAQLIAPVAASYGCITSGPPTAFNAWLAGVSRPTPVLPSASTDGDFDYQAQVELLQRQLLRPLVAGTRLCFPPGTGLHPNIMRRQKEIQRKYESPMIPELLAGTGAYAGPTGFEPYLRSLEPYKAAYEPVNAQLLKNWDDNWEKLLELRKIAEQHLWPGLHNEWLPEIRKGTKASEFTPLIKRATNHPDVRPLLDGKAAKLAMGTIEVAAEAGVIAGSVALAKHAGVPPSDTFPPAVAAVVAGKLVAHAKAGSEERRNKRRATETLSLFYQEAESLG
jgi:hypothetical protein